MSIEGPGREQLRELAKRLKDAGDEGKGFRRELTRQMDAAAQPLAREIASLAHLEPYMPDRYAAVLADDLSVTTQKLFAGASPRVSIVAKARRHKRKVSRVNDGLLMHPVFAQGPRRAPRHHTPEELARKMGVPVHLVSGWTWLKEPQTAGMKPGFFSEPCEKAVPDIRDHVLEAMAETGRKIADGR